MLFIYFEPYVLVIFQSLITKAFCSRFRMESNLSVKKKGKFLTNKNEFHEKLFGL